MIQVQVHLDTAANLNIPDEPVVLVGTVDQRSPPAVDADPDLVLVIVFHLDAIEDHLYFFDSSRKRAIEIEPAE